MTDVDKGTQPMTYDPPVVEITQADGSVVEYPLRRLGITDTMRIARILAAGMAGIGQELKNIDTMDPGTLGMILLAGAPFAERQVYEFLAGLIGLDSWEDLKDEERFPMGSEVAIIEKLSEHADLSAFLGRLHALMKAPGIKGLISQSKSTSSKADTDGQMKTSSAPPTQDSSSRSTSQLKGKRGSKGKK